MEPGFGRAIRPLWALREDGVFLNHGSFGATPLSVLREQDRIRNEMEQQPDQFFSERIVPRHEHTEIRSVAQQLAEFVGVAGDDIALVENATVGTESVLQSIAFERGDQILITNHQYNAVRLAVESRCNETGAAPLVVKIPLRANGAEIRARIREAASPKVKLAIIDHITSPTAIVFPVEEIVADLHELGVGVLIDGAHAPGQIPLDLARLQPDWYVANAHKWLFAPKGSAFLYAAPDVAGITRPAIVSHFIDMGFPRAFDYVGTRDCSGWLAMPAAIAFLHDLNADRLRRHNRGLLERAEELMSRIGADPIGPMDMCGAMRTFVLPQAREAEESDGTALTESLWHEERIQSRAMAGFGRLLLRISAQAYVDDADLLRLASALERRGWPGR